MRGYTIILSVFLLILAIYRVEAATGAGCKNGYCWAYCSQFTDLWDWCYTKGGDNMDSKGYARCTGTGELGPDPTGKMKSLILQCGHQWKCNGPCSL